jgi:hypothetical protein
MNDGQHKNQPASHLTLSNSASRLKGASFLEAELDFTLLLQMLT